MTATERRFELAIVLCNRGYDTIVNLAYEFEVSRSTIKSDLDFLTNYVYLTTKQGRGGGVFVDKRNCGLSGRLTDEEDELLKKLLVFVQGRDSEVLKNIIRKFKGRG